MRAAPIPRTEAARMAALKEADLLDTPPEAFFDEAVKLAASICGVPIALVSLIDHERQWFKARVGLAATETHRDYAFCAHAILGDEPLVVNDATRDERFHDNPLVTGAPNVTFYAGIPLVTADEQAVGTLCVIDNEPRVLTPEMSAALQSIAKMVSLHIESRRAHIGLARLGGDSSVIEDLVENAQDMILCASPTGSLVYVNHAWRHALGYRDTPVHTLSLNDVIAPDMKEHGAAALARLVRGELLQSIETVFVGRDGQRVLVEGTATCQVVDGVPTLLRCILRDVTDKRRQDAELAKANQSNAVYEQIVAHIPTGLEVFELPEGAPASALRFVFVNAAGAALTGSTPSAMVGQKLLDVFKSRRAGPYAERIASTLETRAPHAFEYVDRDEAGALSLVVSFKAFPLPGRRIGLAAEDITGIRRAEQQLQESEGRLRTVFQSIQEGVLTVDEDGHVESMNRAARALFRVPTDDAMRLSAWLPLDLTNALKPRELEATRADGSRFPAEVVAVPLEADGKKRFVVVVRDLTSRLEVERVKREFVSTVSHELRTPLTSIRGALGLLEGGVMGPLEPRTREIVRIARTNAERLVSLVNDILDLEKVDAGKLELHCAENTAASLVESAFDAVRGMADAASVRLEAALDGPALIRCDEQRIVQVLTNLLSNAVKFSPQGASVVVRVGKPSTGLTRFSVVDQGPGIPAAAQSKLFGRFQQLDGSDQRKVGGSGLGLAIVKAIVEQHGGRVGVDSEPGRGSCFWIELRDDTAPAAAAQAPAAAPVDAPVEPRATPTVPMGARALLVIEPDDARFARLDPMLGDAGFEVRRARSIDEGLTVCATFAPAAVIVDVDPLGDPARELLKRLRAEQRTRGVPCIMLATPSGDDAGSGPLLVEWMHEPLTESRLRHALRWATRGPGQRARVLIVDDDPSLRSIVAAQLSPLGIDCTEAVDGGQALALLERERFDLVVLDVAMPRMDGYELVARLRRHAGETPPLLVYSGGDLDGDSRARLSVGITRHLMKARSSEQAFLDAVRELLGAALPVQAAAPAMTWDGAEAG